MSKLTEDQWKAKNLAKKIEDERQDLLLENMWDNNTMAMLMNSWMYKDGHLNNPEQVVNNLLNDGFIILNAKSLILFKPG